MISAIIMASGFSSRMGQNKLLMSYNNKTIIQNVLDVVKNYDFKEVIVVSQYKKVLEIAKEYNFKGLINENAHLGQSESIKIGISNCDECDGYMFFVGDQPLIKESDVNKLIKAFKEDKEYIIIPTYKGKKGNPVIFPRSLKGDFLKIK
ncbi:MAG: NTP transferase domain-containing protein [Paraclostridium sp.]